MHYRHLYLIVMLLLGLPQYSQSRTFATPHINDSVPSKVDSLDVNIARSQSLQEVTVKGTRLLFVVKNDTTIYNLDALNLKEGAMLRDAFEKLPGMTFQNGILYHNGREVKRILINGVDFSSKNPMLALYSLPSYIMKDVKVYERKSDFAMMFDEDDGQEQLVAEVTVRRKYLGIWTGEIAAGGGTKGRYVGRGYANTFTDQHRISIFGNANNTNEQMWYNGDGTQRMGTTRPGDNQFYTPGTTFYWKTPKAIKEKGYFKIESGWDYNKELYDYRSQTDAEQYLSDGSLFSASDTRRDINMNRVSGHVKMDWRMTDALALDYLGALGINKNATTQSTLSANWNENPYTENKAISEILKNLLSANSNQPNAMNLQHKQIEQKSNGIGYNHTLNLTYDMGARTYLKLSHTMSLNNNSMKEQNNTYYKYFNDEAANSMRINRSLDNNGNNMTQGVMARVMKYFSVNGFKRFCLSAEYNYNREKSSNEEKGFLSDFIENSQSGIVDDETTRSWNSLINHHSIQGSLSAGKGIYYFELKPTFNYRSDEITYSKRNLSTINPQHDYYFISGRSLFRIKSPNVGSLAIQYGITSNIPNINYFVTYPDKSDPQHIILGNDKLREGTKQVIGTWGERYFTKETEKGKITRTISGSFFFNHSTKDVTNYTTYNRKTGVMTIKPVNVSGNWDGKLNVSFNTPLDVSQHFWIETSTEEAILRTKTFVTAENEEMPKPNDNRLHTYSLSVKPRIKYNSVDASIKYEATLEDNHGSYFSVNNKELWQHHIEGKLTSYLPWDITLDAEVKYHNYAGYLSGKRENWLMLNFAIERVFLKGKNLSAEFAVHDLLNQENGFLQQYSATALTRSYCNTLGRFALLTLRYYFSTKKK